MNTIDTRELYTRLCELETLRDAVTEAEDSIEEFENQENDPETEESELEKLNEELSAARLEFGDDEQAELAELEGLRDEIGESEFRNGTQLIPQRDFQEYAQQYAEDIGAIPDDLAWPCTCIDWEAAADELENDFSAVTWQGVDYLFNG